MALSHFQRVGLVVIGLPWSITMRLFRVKYVLIHSVHFTCPDTGRTLTVHIPFEFDGFTWAPNLVKQNGRRSDGAPAHDYAWKTARWDNGDRMTFDECNLLFRRILESENQPEPIIGAYYRAVCNRWLRRKWRKRHLHA